MKINHKEKDLLFLGGMLILLLGVLLTIIEHQSGFWIYAIGLISVIIARVKQFLKYNSNNKRVFIPYLFSTVSYILAGYLIYTGKNYWIIFILLSAVLDLYFSFRKE